MAYTASGAPPQVVAPSRVEGVGATWAFWILRVGFTVLPIVVGLDKFTNLLCNWAQYLAPAIPRAVGLPITQIMTIVGVVEVIAGLVVAVVPRAGAAIVAIWLALIIGNLSINPMHFWDIAMRDFGLFLAAISLAFLASDRHGFVSAGPPTS